MKTLSIIKSNHNLNAKNIKQFSKMSKENHLVVFETARSNFYVLKNTQKDLNNSELSYYSFLVALDNHLNNMSETDKNIINDDNLNNINKDELKQKVKDYWAIIKELREVKKLSYDKIAYYLEKRHKFKISRNWLYKIWIEIEGK